VILDNWLFRQTKPKQTQFKPKQTQLKPKQTQFKPNQMLIWAIISCLLKYSFQYPFLIKSWPKIAENREIMAFTVLRKAEISRKNREKQQSGKEVQNVLEPI
jgi:hypothetical protein